MPDAPRPSSTHMITQVSGTYADLYRRENRYTAYRRTAKPRATAKNFSL